MIKSFEKLKVRIDQNLNRGEKSEALTEDVVKIKNKVTCLKQVCDTVTKKLSEGVSSSSSSSSNVKGNDGAAVEKRIRKTAEFGLGQTFQENGRNYAFQEKNADSVSKFLVDGGMLLNDLATNHVTYEIEVEKLVLNPLNGIVQEYTTIEKEEKRNKQNSVDFDTQTALLTNHRTKLDNIGGNASNYAEGLKTEEKLASELAEIETKLNHSRESVELCMLQFLSKESEVGQLLLKYFELKRDYHATVAERISQQFNAFEKSLCAAAVAPTFGCDLGSHIERNSSLTRSRLAFPLRLCVVRILQLDGLQEDGIFRVSAPATKIKRLSALIDAGECNDEDASYANDIYDVHVFAGTLKLYLRELPQALMCSTRDMYAEWMSACGCSSTDRRGAIKALLYTLPDDNFRNLHYLFAFLNHVSNHSHQNKMTSSNLSIVMAPNLLFHSAHPDDVINQGNAPPKLDFAESNLVNDIIESLINNVEYYFGESEVDFFQDPPTLIGSKKMTLKAGNILNASVHAGKQVSSLTLRETSSDYSSRQNTSSGQSHNSSSNSLTSSNKIVQDSSSVVTTSSSNTPKHQYPPVPAQRTPVPKPRGSKPGYGKANPPPRPTERPMSLQPYATSTNSQSPPEKGGGKSITKL